MLHRETVVGVGLMLVAGFFLFYGSQLSFGTGARMGPGFMPVIAAAILGVLGAVILIQNLIARQGDKLPHVNWWALAMVVLGIAAFAALLKPLGLVLASTVLIIIADLASDGRNWLRTIASGLFLGFVSALIFVKGIGLQMPLWPWFMAGF
ncbi:membrane protein [Nitratireductor aestuarii]|jgi:hypothetical protein|uniref:Membrane protein n=1 Tax=Nitratireductor aestuarii TaxID=1735103 RepID=A0A916RXF6_9HYPH|nr:tripartite tricarboxylate transporter TctB family protein [Nitratireductor aestuarii]GGA75074.1 membrane protein [Nitratireductor aestuarii]